MMAEKGNVIYRGEGIQNLVLANEKDKKVYRLMKIAEKYSDNNKTIATDEKERSKKIHQALENNIGYIKYVMEPLLTSAFIVIPKIKEIPEGFAERMEEEVQHVRPAHRKIHENDFRTVDPATCSALVLPDLCYVTDTLTHSCISDTSDDSSPTISVEIKPKKGFIALATVNNSAMKYQVCKFCMHQRLKAKEGRWRKTSSYCPLDLFSGNRARMKSALLALYKTPQNNLKICQNGVEVFSGFSQGDLGKVLQSFFGHSINGLKNGTRKQQELDIFLDLIIDALLYVPKKTEIHTDRCGQSVLKDSESHVTNCCVQKQSTPSHKSLLQSCVNSKTSAINDQECALPPFCVLERVLSIQMLDTLDIEGVYPLYRKMKDHMQQHPADREKLNLNGPFTEETWLFPCLDCHGKYHPDSVEYAVSQVKKHNVSKTMQDCSIMVALQRLTNTERCSENEGKYLTDCHGRKFQFSVYIIDLDPKPVDKIQKYYTLQSSILKAYTENS